eukprot:306113-Pelagomonas_calceolata.AAC.1
MMSTSISAHRHTNRMSTSISAHRHTNRMSLWSLHAESHLSVKGLSMVQRQVRHELRKGEGAEGSDCAEEEPLQHTVGEVEQQHMVRTGAANFAGVTGSVGLLEV